MQLLDGCKTPRQQFIYTQLVAASIIFFGNNESLFLCSIRILGCYRVSDDITFSIELEIFFNVEDELVANLRLLINCSFAESQQLIYTEFIFTRLILSDNNESLFLISIRIFRCYGMGDDVTISIKPEIIRSIKYEFVAHLCLGESQQLIDIQLILSGLRTGLYDRKTLVLCFIRILGSDRMSDDIAIRIKGKIFSYQQTTK